MAIMDYGDYTTATCDYQIYAPPTASSGYVYVDGNTTSSTDATCTWQGTTNEYVDNSVKTIWRKDVGNDMRILTSTWTIWNETFKLQTAISEEAFLSEGKNWAIDNHLQQVQAKRASQGINEPTRTHEDLERDEERMERERIAAEERQVQAKKEQEKKDSTEKVAKELLKSLIGKVDYELYLKEGYVQVEGRGGKAYKIVPGRTIEILKGGAHENSLCIDTRDVRLPPSDEVIWKKLMLEGDEKGLLQIANLQG